MSIDLFKSAAKTLEKLCEEVGLEPLLYEPETLREAIHRLPQKNRAKLKNFVQMGGNEFIAVATQVFKNRREKVRESTYWQKLWPITDRFEEFCISQNIPMPSYQRYPRKMVIEEFNAIDPATLNTDQAETWHHFQSMSQADFDRMFGELYNPFRLSDRKKH